MRQHNHDEMSMDRIMRRWPGTIRAVLDNGLLCAGCPIAPFHTVNEAIREHGIDGTRFRAALRAAMLEGEERSRAHAPLRPPSANSRRR